MKSYHEASKIVKPKLEALAIAEGQMDAANQVTNGFCVGVCGRHTCVHLSPRFLECCQKEET